MHIKHWCFVSICCLLTMTLCRGHFIQSHTESVLHICGTVKLLDRSRFQPYS